MIGLHNIYPVDESIATFDLDTDVEEYNYDGRTVYRGNLDPEYSKEGVQVYWLYDEDNKRVGVAEHDSAGHKCLWYRDNVFSTLLQEEWTVYDETVWNIMTDTAYNDCMKRGWTTVEHLKTRTQALKLVTPDDIAHCGKPPTKFCSRCLSTRLHPGCIAVVPGEGGTSKKQLTLFDTLFVDEDGTIYIPPGDSVVYRCCDDDYATFLRRGAAAGACAGAATTTAGSNAAAPPP
jgi:hypothetical protein